ncbi:MAG: hypothetical protein BYD32DRAFT_462198 [Podila humilis]|nr:MAG: hypothetical protein BYD32DRAFT_462198 [Podila humilis]
MRSINHGPNSHFNRHPIHDPVPLNNDPAPIEATPFMSDELSEMVETSEPGIGIQDVVAPSTDTVTQVETPVLSLPLGNQPHSPNHSNH